MNTYNTQLKGEIVTCPSCDIELELDESESRSRSFSCPECGGRCDLDTLPIDEVAAPMVKQGEIYLSFGERFKMWLGPVLYLSFAMLLFLQKPIDSVILGPLPYIFIFFGLVDSYRALTSARLTFIPSLDPVTKKQTIARQLQEKCRWHISDGKGGFFVFIDRSGINRREILLICTEEGYYLNCMVRAYRLGLGVSLLQTRRVVKIINQLSAESINTHVAA